MRVDRFAMVALMATMIGCAGCSGVGGSMPVPRLLLSDQERDLAAALDQLRVGNEQPARDLLEKIVDGAPVAGVTAEALFRLALLSLREEGGKGSTKAQVLLERLAGSYPDSIWTRQSAALLAHLAEVKALRNRQRELKSLRDSNLSLSRDNRGLRLSLDRLKQLDLELEQKIKR